MVSCGSEVLIFSVFCGCCNRLDFLFLQAGAVMWFAGSVPVCATLVRLDEKRTFGGGGGGGEEEEVILCQGRLRASSYVFIMHV